MEHWRLRRLVVHTNAFANARAQQRFSGHHAFGAGMRDWAARLLKATWHVPAIRAMTRLRVIRPQVLGDRKMNALLKDTVQVIKVVTSGARRKLILLGGAEYDLHRFASVGKGDCVRLIGAGASRSLIVPCLNGEARITPAFSMTTHVPGISQPVHVKEIETEEELAAYERLAGYHYRNQASFGRKSIIVARIGSARDVRVIGYIEVTNTFSGHNARNTLLNAPFADDSLNWSAWNLEAKRNYLNAIARISRCVVHPEYRGIGIGTILCRSSIAFCKRSWQVSRLRPIFLEITADMLKFVPFAEKSGMRYIGTTSGNIRRLVKDQTYLRTIREDINSGARDRNSHSVFADTARSILKRQRRDVDDLQRIGAESGVEMVQLLRTYIDADAPEQLPPSAYEMLHRFLRFPKPTYMIGLSPAAEAFLTRRLAETAPPRKDAAPDFSVRPLSAPIVLRQLSISHRIEVPSDPWANAIQEAFGIHQSTISATGIRELSLAIQPREILYVWGASGSGKTLLLDCIRGSIRQTSGEITSLNPSNLGVLDLSFSERPVVQEVGESEDTDIGRRLYALNLVGLSEANLYFKSPRHLSNGQRYRLALAKLMLLDRPVWIVDEFCSVLDDNTAEITAWNFSRFARRLGATAIVAGPRREPVLSALRPDRVLTLDALGEWKIERGSP